MMAVAVAACSSSTTDFVEGGEVASVSVDPPTASVSVGAQVPLQAIVEDATGKAISGAEVHWSTQNASIATVSANGVVTGVALGTTQIAASSNGKSGIATLTVEKTPVASVAVSPPHVDAAPGDHPQFTAIVYDAAQNPLSGRTVTWSTSNANVATVDASGQATAVGPGTATITGTSEGRNGAATITVSQAPVASVTVTPNPLAMTVGQSTQLAATLKDANGTVLNGRTVTWSSSSTTVATVNAQGVLTAVAQGTATITATSEGKSGTAAITITNVAVGSVTVQPQSPSIIVGTNIQMSATVRDVNGNVATDRLVTWSSSNTSVASVSATGIVTGAAPGSVTITATSEGKSGTSPLTVSPVPVGSVTVSPASASVRAGATTTLAATVKDANGIVVTNRVVTWTSSNSAVATVSGGVVTGVAGGTVTITATSEGKSGTASVTVTPIPVGSVTVSPSTKALLVTQTFGLTATVKDSAGTVVTDRLVTWTSSAPLVASVSSTGVVTALVPGTATITATSETKSGTASITVSLVPISQVVVQPGSLNLPANSTSQLTAVAQDSIGGTLTGRTFLWSSSATAVATVSSTGLVTAVATGAATITATSEGKSGTSAITVYVPAASVTLAPTTKTIIAGDTTRFTPTLRDASNNILSLTGRTIAWTSSNPTVGSVSASGLATGTGVGTTTITATTDGKSGTATLTVNAASVSVTPALDSTYVGNTATFVATAKDKNGVAIPATGFSWSSTAGAVAFVSTSGVATGLTPGSTSIVATLTGQSGSGTLKVLAPVATVTVTPLNPPAFSVGSGVTLTATPKDASNNVLVGRVITWSTTDPTVATVTPVAGTNTATVTGVKAGTAVVTATSEGKSGSTTITVKP